MRAMATQRSVSTGKPYPMRQILSVAELSSSAWYDKRPRKGSQRSKPGPRPYLSDDEVLSEIKAYLRSPDFNSEGYIKIHARLRRKGLRVGKNRVYKLMQEANLLNETIRKTGSGRIHDGSIITERPNTLWATDGKEFWTEQEGKCHFIGVIDHFDDQIMSFHLCKKFDRYAAMEPLREAIKNEFGSVDKGVCNGLGIALRSDHGSQFYSREYQKELRYLGIDYSPAFVRSPECNGIIERFHRTLNEQIFHQKRFKSLEQAEREIGIFIKAYNEKWLLHRLGLRSPIEYREAYMKQNVNELSNIFVDYG